MKYQNVRFPICVHSASDRFTLFCGILAFFLWHFISNRMTPKGEVFQHNSAVSCHKCWMSCFIFMYLFYIYVSSIFSYIMYSITFVLDVQVWGVQKKTFKIWHISHNVWMFSQHVAGSLTWITTAGSTAPSPSLSFCSSKCQFCFLSPCLLSSARRETSIFVWSEKMTSRMTFSQICQRDITKLIG